MRFKIEKGIFTNELSQAAALVETKLEPALTKTDRMIQAFLSATYKINRGEIRIKIRKGFEDLDRVELYNAFSVIFHSTVMHDLEKSYGQFDLVIE